MPSGVSAATTVSSTSRAIGFPSKRTRDSDVCRPPLSREALPITDHAAGRDGAEPAHERRRTDDAEHEALTRCVRLVRASAPGGKETHSDDVGEPQADGRKLQHQKRIADVLGAVR